MSSLREKRKEELKLKIYETSMSLFLEQGYDNTSISQIAEACSMAKGTFFNYFPKKEAVLTYFGQIQYQRVKELVEKLQQESVPADRLLERLFNSLLDKTQENPNLTRMYIVETLRSTMTMDYEYENQVMVAGIIAQVLECGKKQGIFNEGFDSFEVADNLMLLYVYKCCQWAKNSEYDLYGKWASTFRSYMNGLNA